MVDPAFAAILQPGLAVAPFSVRGGYALLATGACLLSLVFFLVVELLAPEDASLGALMVIPVAVAAWFLPLGGAATVIGLAVLIRIAAVVEGMPPVTVASEIILLLVAATALRLAGRAQLQVRAREATLKEQSQAMAASAERERIADELTQTAGRALFAATLELQAAASVMPDQPARSRVEGVVAKLDAIHADLRSAVFSRR